MFAIGIVKRYSDGLEDAKKNAIVALCSFEGFISVYHHNIKLEHHAERPFLTLTNASDLLQMAIVRSLNVLCIRIFLKFASADYDCGNIMKGQDSVLRNALLVLTRDIWVLIGSRTGRGWNRKLALGHRTDGAEFNSDERSIKFLNSRCGEKVNKRLGEVACNETKNAIKELCEAFMMLAKRRGPCLPQDMLMAFRAADRDRNEIEFDEEKMTIGKNYICFSGCTACTLM